MTNSMRAWNPLKASVWADLFGLVPVPLFADDAQTGTFSDTVLLDGEAGSFYLSVSSDHDFLFSEEPTSRAWSSNVRHAVIINPTTSELFLRRWDSPPGTSRRFRLPNNAFAGEELLRVIEEAPAPRSEDVILFVLRAFRTLRNSAPWIDGLAAIQLLNVVLLGTSSVIASQIAEEDWLSTQTYGDAVALLPPNLRTFATNGADEDSALDAKVDRSLLNYLLQGNPVYNRSFQPALLLRHASGRLYQEAHLRLERENSQLTLPGLTPDTPIKGDLGKDVRFTPPALARALVQQALNSLGELPKDKIEILDPACGSGVFLQESLRELVSRGYRGRVSLTGFDTSMISCTIARFCLGLAKEQAGELEVDINIKLQDALSADWSRPDIVLMNPPFTAWERLDITEQNHVRAVLDNLHTYRVDLSMAFVWKGVQALKSTAVLASVLPAPILETESGYAWREAIADSCDLELLGRFEGFGFFRGSVVEPGILVCRPKREATSDEHTPVTVLVASSGFEEKALRGLRQPQLRAQESDSWDVFPIHQSVLSPSSWMPRFSRVMKRVEEVTSKGLPATGDLFHIHQGARTGDNRAFVISDKELRGLPKREQVYFRPMAGNATVRDGVLAPGEFVFYPYDASGPQIVDEGDLKKRVPTFYERWLEPRQDTLTRRNHVQHNCWWLLDRPRKWQMETTPKIVSTYFGNRGSFAYDRSGTFVVVQGHAWFWRQDNGRPKEFAATSIPLAYLGLLNSQFFEQLLEGFCPRVRGGQFNLSKRFVNQTPLPDLSDNNLVTGSVVEQLVHFGKRMATGKEIDARALNAVVARAYSVAT